MPRKGIKKNKSECQTIKQKEFIMANTIKTNDNDKQFPATQCSLGYLTGFSRGILEAYKIKEGAINGKPVVTVPIYIKGIETNRIIITGMDWNKPFVYCAYSMQNTADDQVSWSNANDDWPKNDIVVTDNLLMALLLELSGKPFLFSDDLDYLKKMSVVYSFDYMNVLIFSSRVHRWFESGYPEYKINIRLLPQGAFINFRNSALNNSLSISSVDWEQEREYSDPIICYEKFFWEICEYHNVLEYNVDIKLAAPIDERDIVYADCPNEYGSALDNLGMQIAWERDKYDEDGYSYYKGAKICRYPDRIINCDEVKACIPQIMPENSISPHISDSDYIINCMVDDGILKKVYDVNEDKNIYYMNEFEERFGFFNNYQCSEKHYL